MATNMPWKQPNTMVNASASSFLKQKKIPLFNTFTVHCLAPLYQFVHWRVSKIAVPCAGKMCRGFCCCRSLCFTLQRGEENCALLLPHCFTRESLMKDQIAMDSEINEIQTLKM